MFLGKSEFLEVKLS